MSADDRVADQGRGYRGRPVLSKGPIIRTLEALDAVVLVVVIVFVAVAIVKFGQEQDRTHKIAIANRHLAMQASALAREFQRQRLNNIRAGCETQNEKLTVTTRRLDRVLRKRVADGEIGKAQATVLRTENLFLLTAIVPHQDCAKLVARAQRTGEAPIATVEPPGHN